jgi:hypothetical protein
VLCAVTIPPADLRSLSLYYYAVCGRMFMSSVIRNCCITDDIHKSLQTYSLLLKHSTELNIYYDIY